jgi:hypothetical protein
MLKIALTRIASARNCAAARSDLSPVGRGEDDHLLDFI